LGQLFFGESAHDFLGCDFVFSVHYRARTARNALAGLVMKLGKLLYKISVVLLAIVSMAPWTIGQSTFGGIVGVVKDPSQGAVVAAELTLTNLDDHFGA
jgi:hypothetical protein